MSSIRQVTELAVSDRTRLVPVIGSGVSHPLGLPLWHELVQGLAEQADIACQTLGEPPQVMQTIKTKMGATQFYSSIQQLLALPDDVTTSTLHALSMSGIPRILTTNLDFAIENAFALSGIPLRPDRVCRGSTVEELAAIDFDSENPSLVKIHGSLERPSTWVLTQEEYDKAYVSPGALKEFLSQRMDR